MTGQWNKTFKELKSQKQKLNLDSMSSKNILQNEKDTKMFSDILKVFNYQLKCTTKKYKRKYFRHRGNGSRWRCVPEPRHQKHHQE